MNTVKISPKYQVVIPIEPITKLKGFLKGINTDIQRTGVKYFPKRTKK